MLLLLCCGGDAGVAADSCYQGAWRGEEIKTATPPQAGEIFYPSHSLPECGFEGLK